MFEGAGVSRDELESLSKKRGAWRVWPLKGVDGS